MNQLYSITAKTACGINYCDLNPTGHETIILMHGLGADCQSWPSQMEALAQEGFHPVALDLPGFGKSPRYKGRWTVAKTARLVQRFVEALGQKRYSLCGISMGGTVALEMALEYGENINRLILINTFARLQPKSFQQALYFLRRFLLISSGDRHEQAEYVASRIFPEEYQQVLRDILEEKILEADMKVYRQAMVSLGLFREEKRLGQINIPTLIITGANDTTVAPETQEEMAAAIPFSKHIVIDGGGHGVTVDHPDQVNSAMLSFFKEEREISH